MKSITQFLTLCFVLSLIYSCKKNEEPLIIPEIPEIPETKPDSLKTIPAENYFTFLKDGNEFTYRRTCFNIMHWEQKTDTHTIEIFTVKVTKSSVENYFELNIELPQINTKQLYSDSSFIGSSPFDSIISKDFKPKKGYYHDAIDISTGYTISNTKVLFEGDSLDVARIYYTDYGDPNNSKEILISKDNGIISAYHSSHDWTPNMESICSCKLIGRNF